MESTGSRIAKTRKELGLSQASLAKRVGVSHVAISQWEKGETSPTGKNIIFLAEALQKDPAWIVKGTTRNHSAKGACSDADENISRLTFGNEDVLIPYLEEVELAAGCGRISTHENSTLIKYPLSILEKHGIKQQNVFCARVTGNSMEPLLPDGTIVGVNTGCTRIKDGSIYAINQGGLLRLKSLYRQSGKTLRVRSINPDKSEYPDEIYTGTDLEDIFIIGKVFWYSAIL